MHGSPTRSGTAARPSSSGTAFWPNQAPPVRALRRIRVEGRQRLLAGPDAAALVDRRHDAAVAALDQGEAGPHRSRACGGDPRHRPACRLSTRLGRNRLIGTGGAPRLGQRHVELGERALGRDQERETVGEAGMAAGRSIVRVAGADRALGKPHQAHALAEPLRQRAVDRWVDRQGRHRVAPDHRRAAARPRRPWARRDLPGAVERQRAAGRPSSVGRSVASRGSSRWVWKRPAGVTIIHRRSCASPRAVERASSSAMPGAALDRIDEQPGDPGPRRHSGSPCPELAAPSQDQAA